LGVVSAATIRRPIAANSALIGVEIFEKGTADIRHSQPRPAFFDNKCLWATRKVHLNQRSCGLTGPGSLAREAGLTAKLFFERRGFVVLTQQSVEKRRRALTKFRIGKAALLSGTAAICRWQLAFR
jgi:hypothetical protein